MKTLTPEDAGCWIDGHHGQYATPMMLRIAVEYGWDGLDDAEKDAMMQWLNGLDYDGDEVENLIDAADEAENWLNEHVAPAGYSFGWHDGEFFLQADEWWSDEESVNCYPLSSIPNPFGGVSLFAVMDDGDYLCESCVRDSSNPVHVADDSNKDGWGVVGWDTTGNTDERVQCAHCGKVVQEEWSE